MDRKRYMALGLSVVLGMSMTACQKEEEPEEEVAVAVEVENPRTGELTVDTAYIGTVAPQEQVYVIPKELFPCWLEAEKTNDLKEEKLYENRPIQR